MYRIKRAKRLSQDFVHFVTALASLLTEHRMSGLPIRAKYKHFSKQLVSKLVYGMAAAIGLSNSPRGFESFFVILAIRIDEVNSSQSSSIVEFWLLIFPWLFFSILSGFTNFRPYFWPHVIWSGGRLNFCQSPHGPHISFGRFFFQ